MATTGGMGPGTLRALDLLLAGMGAIPDALLASATDNDPPGERYAAFLAERAAAAGVRCERLLPPRGLNDWNDVLMNGRGGMNATTKDTATAPSRKAAALARDLHAAFLRLPAKLQAR